MADIAHVKKKGGNRLSRVELRFKSSQFAADNPALRKLAIWLKSKGNDVRKNLCIIAIAAIGLAACVTPPPAGKISDTAVAQTTLSIAAQAVDICGRTFPNVTGAADALQRAGFSETAERFENGNELDDPSRQVRVQVGERPVNGGRKEHVCLISVIGMTPAQGFALAQPWVQRYGAITNVEAGQGLSSRAIQA